MNEVERFWAKVDKSGECWEWTAGLNTDGYGRFRLKMMVQAHRLSYVLHHPLTINLLEHREICVCHRCDNRRCVNPEHLFLGSHSDNMKDMNAKGRAVLPSLGRGEIHPASKLTEQQVREIRIRYANGGITQLELGIEYGVCFTTISQVINRETWKHI